MPSLQLKRGEFGYVAKIERESPGNRAFVQVPLEVLARDDLSPAALKLYLVLLAYCGPKDYAWPGQSRLAAQMQLTERRIRSLLKELENAGLVEVKHESGSTNTYILRKSTTGIHQETKEVKEGSGEIFFPAPRKNTSPHVHESDSKHVWEREQPEKANDPRKENSTSVFVEVVELLKAAGLSPVMAEELARLALGNGRDIAYVKMVVEAGRKPEIHNPPGFIRFMLLRNAEPVDRKPRTPRNPRGKTPSVSLQPIDFSKYISGKYSYLASSTPLVEDSSVPPTDLGPNEQQEEESLTPVAELQSAESPAEKDMESLILGTIWLRARAALVNSGLITERTLQYGRLKKGEGTGEYRLEFPGWVKLGPEQEAIIRTRLERFLEGGKILVI